jgi:hypothetical protein
LNSCPARRRRISEKEDRKKERKRTGSVSDDGVSQIRQDPPQSRHPPREPLRPSESRHQIALLRVQPTNERPDTRPSDHIDRNPLLKQRLQRSDVGDSPRSSTSEYDSDALSAEAAGETSEVADGGSGRRLRTRDGFLVLRDLKLDAGGDFAECDDGGGIVEAGAVGFGSGTEHLDVVVGVDPGTVLRKGEDGQYRREE